MGSEPIRAAAQLGPKTADSIQLGLLVSQEGLGEQRATKALTVLRSDHGMPPHTDGFTPSVATTAHRKPASAMSRVD